MQTLYYILACMLRVSKVVDDDDDNDDDDNCVKFSDPLSCLDEAM